MFAKTYITLLAMELANSVLRTALYAIQEDAQLVILGILLITQGIVRLSNLATLFHAKLVNILTCQ